MASQIGAGRSLAVITGIIGLCALAPPARSQSATPAADEAKEAEAFQAAVDAYIYAYPLITMELTRQVSTNTVAPEGMHSPMGQFARLRGYPAVDNHTVTAPNADTLYTILWLDVSAEPWIVSVPDTKGRYYLMPMLDGWTTVFADPGTRTTGNKAQRYAITGPGWNGTLPPGITGYRSATGMVWLLGRIYCTGTPADYKAVHELQDKITAVPLSSYGKPYQAAPGTVDPAVDMKTAVRAQVGQLDATSYFKLFAKLLKTNPPTAADAPMMSTLAKIGIAPGQDFNPSKLDAATVRGMNRAPKVAEARILGWFRAGVAAGDAKDINGWLFTLKTGTYGTNYLQRALVTAVGLGANLPEDAVYPTSELDATGKPYSGANKYVLHFKKGELPPVKGFWSLTMYDGEFFFHPNRLNRYTLSARDKLKANKDGSVDLYLQNESPGKAKEANWLPAPKDKFIPMLRLYWPKEKPPSLIDGSWTIPPVTQVP